jgi:creatinine amidohydrolase
MTWAEVEQALTRTDMVIIPVGAIEQHGKHLPLCTDICAATEISKLIAQKTDVLVAPAVAVGLSEHHMAFRGTLTLTPETFEAVVYETALSLIHHGFKKILIYNGHGGNNVSVANILEKINQTTPAVAVQLNGMAEPPWQLMEPGALDGHAGVGETSSMMYLTPGLVDMTKAENPILTPSPEVDSVQKHIGENPNLSRVVSALSGRPESTGKHTSTRETTSNGVTTKRDLKTATAEHGRRQAERFIQAAVEFIETWKKATNGG